MYITSIHTPLARIQLQGYIFTVGMVGNVVDQHAEEGKEMNTENC